MAKEKARSSRNEGALVPRVEVGLRVLVLEDMATVADANPRGYIVARLVVLYDARLTCCWLLGVDLETRKQWYSEAIVGLVMRPVYCIIVYELRVSGCA